jgi:hypothetical protein
VNTQGIRGLRRTDAVAEVGSDDERYLPGLWLPHHRSRRMRRLPSDTSASRHRPAAQGTGPSDGRSVAAAVRLRVGCSVRRVIGG